MFHIVLHVFTENAMRTNVAYDSGYLNGDFNVNRSYVHHDAGIKIPKIGIALIVLIRYTYIFNSAAELLSYFRVQSNKNSLDFLITR